MMKLHFKIHSSKLAKECANLPDIYLKSYVVNGKFFIKKANYFRKSIYFPLLQ